jgi:hypothetical protein
MGNLIAAASAGWTITYVVGGLALIGLGIAFVVRRETSRLHRESSPQRRARVNTIRGAAFVIGGIFLVVSALAR